MAKPKNNDDKEAHARLDAAVKQALESVPSVFHSELEVRRNNGEQMGADSKYAKSTKHIDSKDIVPVYDEQARDDAVKFVGKKLGEIADNLCKDPMLDLKQVKLNASINYERFVPNSGKGIEFFPQTVDVFETCPTSGIANFSLLKGRIK